MDNMTITDEVSAKPAAVATSAPVARPSVVVAAEKKVVTVQAAEPTATATQAAKTPLGLSAVLAGLGCGSWLCVHEKKRVSLF